ncbi:PDZ/DHR/GLGF domain protein, partial [Ostertagia ostertagi]
AKQVSRSKFWGEARTVVLEREPNKSFGISIVGGRVEVSQKGGLPGTGSTVSGIFIKSVLPNSPAGRSGMMNMGDRVISVNDIDLREATHEQAVNAIKNATNPVRFVLQSLHSFTPQQRRRIDRASNSTVTDDYRYTNDCKEETPPPPAPPPPPTVEPEVEKEPKESPKKEPEVEQITAEPVTEQPMATEEPTIEEPKTKEEEKGEEVEQIATSESVSEQQPSPSKSKQSEDEEQEEIESPSKESVASEPRRLSLEKSQPTSQSSNGTTCKRDSLRSEDCRKESGPLIVSDVSSSEAHEDEPSTSTAQYPTTSAEPTISPSTSAAELPKDSEDDEEESKFGYTQAKLKRKYGHLNGDVLLVSCERVPEAGLGISLAGNRNREKNNTFVLSVKVQCPLTVRAGDELLEVNGRVLVGHSHVVASSIVRQCCDKGEGLEIVVCRRDGSMDDVAVRSTTEPPAPDVSEDPDVVRFRVSQVLTI